MTQRIDNYLTRALHDAKIEDLIDRYSRNGYVVQRNVKTDSGEFDLVVKNEAQNKTIAFEVKLLPITKAEQSTIEALGKEAANLGYEFRLVTIARPVRLSIDIDWLEDAFLEYIINSTISDIDEMATHVQYKNVEVIVDAIHVTDDNARATVHGNIDVELQYGSNSDLAADIGYVTPYSIPFDGELELDLSAKIVDDAELHVDLSEWVDARSE